MKNKKSKDSAHSSKPTWGQWLKQQKTTLTQRDDHCHDPSFQPHKWSSQGFAGTPSPYSPGVIPRVSKKQRESKCEPR